MVSKTTVRNEMTQAWKGNVKTQRKESCWAKRESCVVLSVCLFFYCRLLSPWAASGLRRGRPLWELGIIQKTGSMSKFYSLSSSHRSRFTMRRHNYVNLVYTRKLRYSHQPLPAGVSPLAAALTTALGLVSGRAPSRLLTLLRRRTRRSLGLELATILLVCTCPTPGKEAKYHGDSSGHL